MAEVDLRQPFKIIEQLADSAQPLGLLAEVFGDLGTDGVYDLMWVADYDPD